MKLKNLFLMGFVALALSLGFTSCDKEKDPEEKKADTFVSVTFKMSTNSGFGAPEKAPASEDYNYLGEWAGKDDITSLAVYVVDGSTVTANTFAVAEDESADYKKELKGGDVVLTPLKAIETTAGLKKIYVLVNGTPEVVAALATASASNFENAYKTAVYAPENSGTNSTVSMSADKVAVKNGVTDEKIVMTNVEEVTINVAPNVTEAQSLDPLAPQNRASVNVQRVVARVMITKAANTFEIKSGSLTLGEISDITWSVAQGENSLYLQQKADKATPNFAWVPDDVDPENDYTTKAGAKYDYSGLFDKTADVPTMADYATNPFGEITADLNAKLSGKFVLPNTHQYGVGEASSYKKGNTAYVLVRAKFTPSAAAYADGSTYTAGDDFYVGENGKFYSSVLNSRDATKGGVAGQKVTKYVGGKVLYYAWLNPDVIPAWYNSPVLRNNVYHIHITGFRNLGTNWNPLYPEDPERELTPGGDPNDPDDYKPKDNPDPKPTPETYPEDPTDPSSPDTPTEEPENPIDPEDPLTTPVTYMSVDVKILPWKVHSYQVDLGI